MCKLGAFCTAALLLLAGCDSAYRETAGPATPEAAFARRVAAIEDGYMQRFDWAAWRADLDVLAASPAYECDHTPDEVERALFAGDDGVIDITCITAEERRVSFTAGLKACPTLMLVRGRFTIGNRTYTGGDPDDYDGPSRSAAPACRELS